MKTACPDEEIIADYIEGRLSENDRASVEAHLSDCEQCLEILLTVREITGPKEKPALEPVPDKITQAAVQQIKKQTSLSINTVILKYKRSLRGFFTWLSEWLNITPWRGWGLSPIRSYGNKISDDLIILKQRFKGLETEIEIEKIGLEKADIRVSLIKDDQTKRSRVTLKRDEREIASKLFENNFAFFEKIPFGHYTLLFSTNGTIRGKFDFQIKESLNG